MKFPDSISLADAFRSKTRENRLSEDELDAFIDLQTRAAPAEKPLLAAWRWLASAATVVVLLASVMVYHTSQADYHRLIAEEVVKNHLKLKPLDIETSSIREIQRYFTQLDFLPAASGLMDSGSQLTGGRYCSVRGVTAAQLRYQVPGQGLNTLYQVDYDPGRFGMIPEPDQGEAPLTLMEKGLKVSLWKEKGLLMVLVSE